jgi:UDP-N-acetylmuramoyl-tripeptide--D-alanyl-D-alanine ligase
MDEKTEIFMYFNEHFLRGVLSEVKLISQAFPEDARFSVDSRSLQPGDIFVAIKGERTDGHDYLAAALKAGASGFIIDVRKQDILKSLDARELKNKLIIAVEDPLEAIFKMARVRRTQFANPIVAVTGSMGKTSTKELLSSILKLDGKECLASHANQNTKLGVALNLLRLQDHHECAVLEVGINARGEMAEIAELLRPNFAIITGIGHCHLEGLGSIGDIAAEKRAIFKYFSGDNIGIVNGDQPLLASVGYSHPIVKFGFKTTNQIQARKVRTHTDHMSFILKIYREKFILNIPQTHNGILFNTLSATAAAYLLGVPTQTIVEAVRQPVMVPGRFERRTLVNKHGILIHDAYNANPESMKAALATFTRLPTKARKIVVLGDMLELGIHSPFWHRQLGRVLRKMSATHHIILVGSEVQWTKKALPVGASVDTVATWQDAMSVLEQQLKQESVVLVKGSHGTGLYQLAEKMSTSIK